MKMINVLIFMILNYIIVNADETKLVITGDLMLARRIDQKIKKEGKEYFFSKYKKMFEESNFGIVNFECSISFNHAPIMKKYNFDCDSNYLDELRNIGITHLNLANNHTIDFGSCALEKNVELMYRKNLIPIGVNLEGNNEITLSYIKHNSNKIALISVVNLNLEKYQIANCNAKVNQYFNKKLEEKIAIEKNRDSNIICIVLLHWGKEDVYYTSLAQELYAKKLIDKGADLIVGCGSHTIQKSIEYKNKKIYFSIGNFIFDRFSDKFAYLKIKIVDSNIIETKLIEFY
jgi:poly-gamma-glutamate capsule biosynthesis protein CapA/YwtB (metallophosphatase superfamily)